MKQQTWLRIVHSGDWCNWRYAFLVVNVRKEEDKSHTTNLIYSKSPVSYSHSNSQLAVGIQALTN